MRPYRSRLQGVTMAPVKRTKDKRDSRRKIRKLVLNRRPPYLGRRELSKLIVMRTERQGLWFQPQLSLSQRGKGTAR